MCSRTLELATGALPPATKRDVLWLAAGEWICLDQQSIEAPVCTCGRVLE